MSLVDLLSDSFTRGLAGGRLQVLGGVQGELALWLFEDHTGAYRYFLLLVTGLAAGAAYCLLRRLGGSRTVGFLFLVIVGASVQFRSYHDPLLGYYGTTQLTVLCVVLSLTIFVGGLRRPTSLWYRSAGLALFVVACLLNDWAYPLCAVHLGIAVFERRGVAAWRSATPFLLTGFAFVGATLFLRYFSSDGPIPGYQVSFNPVSIARTWFIQLFPPLPLTNTVLHHNDVRFFDLGGDPSSAELKAALVRCVMVAAAVAVATMRLGRQRSGVRPGRLAVVGALLLALPPLLIASAPKYQAELNPAKGYLTTFPQVIGWGILATSALVLVLRAAGRRGKTATTGAAVVVSCLFGIAAAGDGFNNVRVVGIEAPVAQTRRLLDRAGDRGVFAVVPSGASLLFSDRDLRWPTGSFELVPSYLRWMVYEYTGQLTDARIIDRAEMATCNGEAQGAPDCHHLGRVAAWVRVQPGPAASVTLALASSAAGPPSTATADRIYVYVEGVQLTPPTMVGEDVAGQPWDSGTVRWQTVRRERSWAWYSAQLDAGASPVASSIHNPLGIVDFTDLGLPRDIVRRFAPHSVVP